MHAFLERRVHRIKQGIYENIELIYCETKNEEWKNGFETFIDYVIGYCMTKLTI